MVEELPLHDATFDGIVMQGKACRMFFSRPDGSGCEVLLNGVDALQMDDFREGNIVVYFGATTREHPGRLSDLARLYTPPHPNAAEEYHEAHAGLLDRKVGAVVSGDLIFVEMSPAIGADLVATCEQVSCKVHGDGS
ncbi:MAG: hypothetical protein VX569_10995 [Pseudomonadota bacterium]|nr:hypothetical protein [Pseudomonadota bacterium]